MASRNKEKNKKVSNKKIPGMVIFYIVCALMGVFLGFFLAKHGGENSSSNGGDKNFIILSVAVFVLIIFIILHIIIHELGHLIFGLATGYSFLSFRIASLVIVKEEGKIKFKKHNIPGTAGQCLLAPPDKKDGKYPFISYNLGGSIMNLITATISILSVILIKDMSFPLDLILILFAAAGIFLGLTNGIPLKISGIPNDGYNVMSIIKDTEAEKGFYIQLKVYALLCEGVRYKELDYNLIQLQEGVDLSNPLNSTIKLMEYSWHLENMDFDKARMCIDAFLPVLDDIVQIHRYEINCERVFLELIGDCNKELVDQLYNDKLKKYIKASKHSIGKKRLMMAYEAFYNNDKEKALEYYKELKKLYKSYPIKGEADMELMFGDWIIQSLNEI